MNNLRARTSLTSDSGLSRTLPQDLIVEAAGRLGWLGLLYSAAFVLGRFGGPTLIAAAGGVAPGSGVQNAIAIVAVGLGIGVYFVSRSRRVPPRRLLDVGLVFEIAGAFGIALHEFWLGLPLELASSLTLIPTECAWIVAFPLIVPNTPRKILIASLLAASTGPAALAISSAVTGNAIDRPLAYGAYFLSTNYVAAGLAYVMARIVHRFGTRLTHAREIGSYELFERIGEGGMGEVWRARHRLLARPAAIKLIRRDLLESHAQSREALVQRFEREARDTAALGSVHTVDVFDFGITEDGDFYYVMELLHGISLDRLVKEFGPIEPARAVHLLRQVCHSLGEAHRRGLLHRDIKPANIFICRQGPDDDFVKVLDFGLVKHFAAPAPDATVTQDGKTAGTPAFMAPELALGTADVDGRTDIYAVGCVAYYLLTGQSVFSRDTPMATVLAHVKETPIVPSAHSEFDVPAALDMLILECLAKDKFARPSSAEALSERLAMTVPADAWTAEAAHDWWELHHVSVTTSTAASEGSGGEKPAPRLRCRPRLDGRQ